MALLSYKSYKMVDNKSKTSLIRHTQTKYITHVKTDTGFSKKGGGGGGGHGLSGIRIFHTWTFRSATYHVVCRPNASQNCKGGQSAFHFMGRGGQNPDLIKTLNILY